MKSFDTLRYKKGSRIFVSGQMPYSAFFIVLNGTVEATIDTLPLETIIIKEGGYLGLICALNQQEYFATSSAITDVELMVVNISDLELLFETKPSVLTKVLSVLTQLYLKYINLYDKVVSKDLMGEYYQSNMFEIAKYFDYNGKHKIANYIYINLLLERESNYNMYIDKNIEEAEKRIAELNISINTKDLIKNNFIEYDKDECIYSEHENSSSIYLIKQGKVALCKILGKSMLIHSILTPPDIFGYNTYFQEGARKETVITLENTLLKKIDFSEFEKELNTNYSLIISMIKIMANKAWSTIKKIEGTTIQNPAGRAFHMLHSFSKRSHAIEDEQSAKKFVTLNFSINEFFDMTGFHPEEREYALNKITETEYIKSFGQFTVINNIDSLFKDMHLYQKINYKKTGLNQFILPPNFQIENLK